MNSIFKPPQKGSAWQMNEEVKPPKNLVPSIPISYSLMVEKMMAKAPGERYQDTGAVLAALEDIEKGVQIAYTAMRIRRRRFRPAVSATIFFILGSGLFAGLWQHFERIAAERTRLQADGPVRSLRDRAEDLLRSSRSLYESGKIDEAALKAREAKETWPDLDAAELLVARAGSMGSMLAAYDGGDPARALRFALEHERSFAGDPLLTALRAKSTAFEAARNFAREGRWNDAIESCGEILAVDPRDRMGIALREGLLAMREVERLESAGKLDEAVSMLLGIAPQSVPNTGKIAEARSRVTGPVARQDWRAPLRSGSPSVFEGSHLRLRALLLMLALTQIMALSGGCGLLLKGGAVALYLWWEQENGKTPPVPEPAVPGAFSGQVMTPAPRRSSVEIRYLLKSDDGCPTDVVPEFSADGGANWSAALDAGAPSEGVTSLSSSPSGLAHTFVWDFSAITAVDLTVSLRISISDHVHGNSIFAVPPSPWQSTSFQINASAICIRPW